MFIFDILQIFLMLMAFYLGMNRLPGVGWFIFGMLVIALFDFAMVVSKKEEKNNEK